jgi:hypothetical protein
MATVHVFVSTGRFRSFEDVRRFIDEQYDENGDVIPSPIMREVGLIGYEPACIEALHRERPVPLPELLATASYSKQWLPQVGPGTADSAICVFEPNRVEHPESCSLEHCGAFEYDV